MALKGKILLELINNQQDIPYIAVPKREGMSFSGMAKLKLKSFLKVSRRKSLKILILFFFHFRISFF